MKSLDKPTPSVKSLCLLWDTLPDLVEEQLAIGIEVEKEHTSDERVAREIALDHLGEDLHYYTKLKRIESSVMNKLNTVAAPARKYRINEWTGTPVRVKSTRGIIETINTGDKIGIDYDYQKRIMYIYILKIGKNKRFKIRPGSIDKVRQNTMLSTDKGPTTVTEKTRESRKETTELLFEYSGVLREAAAYIFKNPHVNELMQTYSSGMANKLTKALATNRLSALNAGGLAKLNDLIKANIKAARSCIKKAPIKGQVKNKLTPYVIPAIKEYAGSINRYMQSEVAQLKNFDRGLGIAADFTNMHLMYFGDLADCMEVLTFVERNQFKAAKRKLSSMDTSARDIFHNKLYDKLYDEN